MPNKQAPENQLALRAGHINGTEVDSMLLEFLSGSGEYYVLNAHVSIMTAVARSPQLRNPQLEPCSLAQLGPAWQMLFATEISESKGSWSHSGPQAVTVSKDAFLGFKAFRTVVLPVPMSRIRQR